MEICEEIFGTAPQTIPPFSYLRRILNNSPVLMQILHCFRAMATNQAPVFGFRNPFLDPGFRGQLRAQNHPLCQEPGNLCFDLIYFDLFSVYIF